MPKRRTADDIAFMQGYVCAAANLVLLHDEPGMARDVLDQLGVIDWKRISEYDRGVLKKAKICLADYKRRRRSTEWQRSRLKRTRRK